VTYGDVSDYAQLGIQAGQAQARREAADRNQQMAMQLMQQSAAQRRLDTEIQARKELAEFSSWMSTESQKRAMAWEQEKMELGARHDFDLIQARKEVDFEANLQAELKIKQERQRKLDALRMALENKEISQKTYDTYRIRTLMDQPAVPHQTGDDLSGLFPSGEDDLIQEGGPIMTINGEEFYDNTRPPVNQEAVQEEWNRIRPTSQKKAGVVSNPYATTIVEHLSTADLPDEEKTELRNIVKNNNPAEMKMAAEIIQADQKARRQQELINRALIPDPSFDIPFAPQARMTNTFEDVVKDATSLVSSFSVSNEDKQSLRDAIEDRNGKKLRKLIEDIRKKNAPNTDTMTSVAATPARSAPGYVHNPPTRFPGWF